MKKFISLCIVMTLLFSGCATIVSGTKQNINISSSPPQADVVIYDGKGAKVAEVTTPRTVRLKKGGGMYIGARYRVEISKDGYAPQTVHIKSRISGWYVGGNLLLGGFIGWLIVDPLTGAMYTLTPKNVNANLKEEQGGMDFSSNDFGKDGIHIILKEQVPQSVFEHYELVQLNK